MSWIPRVPVVDVILAKILVQFERVFWKAGFFEVFTLSQNFELALDAPRPDQVAEDEGAADLFLGVFGPWAGSGFEGAEAQIEIWTSTRARSKEASMGVLAAIKK